MTIDATFWVAISFILFIGLLIYFKIPQKANEILNQLISNIKNEINESEKLRNEAKTLLENSQSKLDSANEEIDKAEKEILDLKNKSPEKIRKIAVETSSDLIQRLIGVEVNNSSISAIVEDVSRKTN